MIRKLENILDKIEIERVGEGTVAKLLTDPAIYDELTENADGITSLINHLENGEGSSGNYGEREAWKECRYLKSYCF